MTPGVLTAAQVAAAYAEIDRLNETSRGDRKDYVQGKTSMQVGHRVSELRRQIERSHVLATHVLHDRMLVQAREIA